MTDSTQILYYCAETEAGAEAPSRDLWGTTKAESLDGAQKAAMTRKMFAPSALWIGMTGSDGNIVPVAVRRELPPHGVSLGWEPI
jgi:hypothetical protein